MTQPKHPRHTLHYCSPDMRHQVEVCPNLSGILFWRSRPMELAAPGVAVGNPWNEDGWSQWLPLAGARNYAAAAEMAFDRLRQEAA